MTTDSQTLTRRGRPPIVTETDGTFHVRVKDGDFKHVDLLFRKNAKGALTRADRTPDVSPDSIAYAKSIVARSL